MDKNKLDKIKDLIDTLQSVKEKKENLPTQSENVEKSTKKEDSVVKKTGKKTLKSGKKDSATVTEPAVEMATEQVNETIKTEEKVVEYKDPTVLSLEEQEHYFGKRIKREIDGSILQYARFGYKTFHTCKVKGCYTLIDKTNNTTIGVVPRILLKSVWKIVDAHSKLGAEKEFDITKDEWEKSIVPQLRKHLEKYSFYSSREGDGKVPLVQDVFRIPELDYQQMFLKKSANIIRLIDRAVKEDVKESVELKHRWKKIKRYKHKIPLAEKFGGLFSQNDVAILKRNGINYVNDLKKHDIYQLKNLLLEHTFARIIEEIHHAYKEDKQRRRDRKLRFWPLFWGFITLIFCTSYSYQFKYTLIKNEKATQDLVYALMFWLVVVITIFYSAIRARRRYKKKKCRKYFTGAVSFFSVMFCLFSIFSIGSIAVFKERFDGYDGRVYYKDLEDNTIAVGKVFEEYQASYITIPEEIDGKTVVRIDAGTFYNDDKIDSVVIPETVTEIQDYAFYKSSVSQVELPSQITYIGKKAFANCTDLDYIDVPENVTSIGEKAFAGCINVSKIIMHGGVEKIGKKAFSGCENLYEIGDISGLNELGDQVFSGCDSLVSIEIPKTITTINKGMFIDSGFETITFVGELDAIGKNAFKGCKNLKKVDLSDTELSSMDKNIFKDCKELEEIILPYTITEIPEGMARGCTNLKSVYVNGEIKSIGKNAFRDSGIETIQGLTSVESIGNNAFRGCKNLTNIAFADSLEYIGRRAFADCENLTEAILPFLGKSKEKSLFGFRHVFGPNSSLKGLGIINTKGIKRSSFSGAKGLEIVVLGDGVVNLPNSTFKNFENLETVVLPASLMQIGNNAFRGCSSLETVQFEGEYLRKIGSNAFRDCTTLTNVDLSGLIVDEMGRNTFAYCTDLKSISLPNGLNTIPYGFARDCYFLRDVDFGKDVTKISANAFNFCTNLETIFLPDSVNEIGYRAFYYCTNLDGVNFGDGLEYIKNRAFDGCSALKSLKLNEGVKEIGYKAFRGCDSMISAYVPDSVVKMRSGVFDDCSELETLTIPFLGRSRDKVKTLIYMANAESLRYVHVTSPSAIKAKAFEGFDYLEEVYILGNDVDINVDAFTECPSIDYVCLSYEKLQEFLELQMNGFRYPKITFLQAYGNEWK